MNTQSNNYYPDVQDGALIAIPAPSPTGTGEIAMALSMAQREMQNPAFDAQNPHFRNRYASLAAVRNAVIPVLAKHLIALTQDVCTQDGAIACVTTLWHSSGQSLRFGPLVLPVSKQDAQGYGSAATYARRYALMAVSGVVGDDDDDAEHAVGRAPCAETLSEQQRAALQALIEETGADSDKLRKYLKVSSLNDILAVNYTTVVKMLEAKRARNEHA